MRWLLILTIFTLFFAGYQPKRAKKGKPFNGRLKSLPQPVNIETCPFVVGFIVVNNNIVTWKCGGAIIRKNVVLTTASCLSGVPTVLMDSGYFRLRSNTSFLEARFEPFIDHTIIEYYIHDDYGSHLNTYDSNIAVARILDEFTGSYERLIYIPRAAPKYENFDNTIVYTWHKLTLQSTNVSLINLQECQTMYQWTGGSVSNRSVCGRVHGRDDFCKEMEGSPLVWEGKLLGLASFAHECPAQRFPALFTNIGMFFDWIHSHFWGIESKM